MTARHVREMVMGKKTLALSLAAMLAATVPSVAMADNGWHRGWYKHHDRYDDGRYYRRGYHRDDRPRYYRSGCRTSGTTGAIIGAGAGALLGRAVDTRGDRLPGTIIGAGAGALIGKEVGSKSRC